MLKILGSVFIVISSALIGILCAKNERRRVEQLEGILGMLRHIREQISYFRRTKSKILTSFSDRRPEMRVFMSNLHANACDAHPLTAAIERSGPRLMLTAEEKDKLITYDKQFGCHNGESEIRCCDYYISIFEEILEKEKKEMPGKIKLYRTLTLMGGLMLVILLI